MVGNRDPLRDELVALRGGDGATVSRLLTSPLIMEALGSPPPERALQTFWTALLMLGNDVKSRALRAAYGYEVEKLRGDLDRTPTNLGERRKAFGLLPDVRLGWERVRDHDESALNALITLLEARPNLHPVSIADDPVRAPAKYRLCRIRVNLRIAYNVVVFEFFTYTYEHRDSGEVWTIRRMGSKWADPFLDSIEPYKLLPDTDFFAFGIPGDGAETVVYEVGFAGSVPDTLEVRCSATLEELLTGQERSLVRISTEDGQFNYVHGRLFTEFNIDPVPGAYLRLVWSGEQSTAD